MMGDDTNRNNDGSDPEFNPVEIIVEIIESLLYSSVLQCQRRQLQVEWAVNRSILCIDDYSITRNENLEASVQIWKGKVTVWCLPSICQLFCQYFVRQIFPVNVFREGSELTAVGFRWIILYLLRKLMLYFLAVFRGTKYLKMHIILSMLGLNALVVNFEVELLFVRHERSKLMPEFKVCLRVTILPVAILKAMIALKSINCFDRIDARFCVYTAYIKKTINNAISVAHMGQMICSPRWELVISRNWLFDEAYPFGHNYELQRAQRTWYRLMGFRPFSRPVDRMETIVEVSEEEEKKEEEKKEEEKKEEEQAKAPEDFSPVNPQQSREEHLTAMARIQEQLDSLMLQAFDFTRQSDRVDRFNMMWYNDPDVSSESNDNAELLSDTSEEFIAMPLWPLHIPNRGPMVDIESRDHNSDNESENDSYLSQLQRICEERQLVAEETESPQPEEEEEEIIPTEDQVQPLESLVQQTDRLIHQLQRRF
ncbi:uncharacterized protein LOC128260290 [Drosophila gunungcola]|uniref:Uncharacterized protein n=1 Tax=Drosophila gunungcola TaxID=103775 RepID=A0A9P9YGK9_9MUSC|nr:uncharacterized protein LOC128260290 [Drosophila gunungcola]KAI8036179.1 hypothetical protein M5D96_011039 [Drosophila gunungcola]